MVVSRFLSTKTWTCMQRMCMLDGVRTRDEQTYMDQVMALELVSLWTGSPYEQNRTAMVVVYSNRRTC